jgi:cytochrome c553
MTYPFFQASGTVLRALVPLITGGVIGTAVLGTAYEAAGADGLGRHLAQECTSCHSGAANGAIPSITGRSVDDVVGLLRKYASGTLADGRTANAAMVSVAQSLSPTEMAAVAAFLATVPPSKP